MSTWRELHSRRVWPPLSLFLVFAVFYGIFDLGVWMMARIAQIPQEIFATPERTQIRVIILAMAASSYAVFRLWRFHPALNQQYAAWLRLSPWTADKPLPLGPVHLVWQDAIVLGVIAVFANWHAAVNPAVPALAFALVYFGGMTLLLACTGRHVHSLILGFLWPMLILPAVEGWPMSFVAAAIVVVVHHGHRMSLREFPWKFVATVLPPKRPGSLLQTEIKIAAFSDARQPKVGWPFQILSPTIQKLKSGRVSTAKSLALSVLLGWWAYCVILRFQMPPMPIPILFSAAVAALLRVVIYRSFIAPSFNLWGRIVSGRIVVPRFDQILLTPLAVVATAVIGAAIIHRSGPWYALVESIVISILAFILLSGGPTLQKWFLTGQHRYRPPRIIVNQAPLQQV